MTKKRKYQYRPTVEMAGISPSGIPQPWGTRYARQKAQAKFRHEAYELTPQQYYDVWVRSGKMALCGVGKDNYTMKRLCESDPWAEWNVHIIPRKWLAHQLGKRYAEKDYVDKNTLLGV